MYCIWVNFYFLDYWFTFSLLPQIFYNHSNRVFKILSWKYMGFYKDQSNPAIFYRYPTGAVQPVQNWVRNSFHSPQKWARKMCNFLTRGSKSLNIWRGKLFHFFQLLNNQMYPKVIVISFVHLQQRNRFAKFGGCGSKNAPLTPLRSLKWSRA